MTARLAFGAMNFGKRTDEAEAGRLVRRALELGMTEIDTANVYNDGESERILGRLLRDHRARVSIATKVGMAREGGRPEGLSGNAVRRAVDASLARLGTDWIDVYYLHVPDHETDIA